MVGIEIGGEGRRDRQKMNGGFRFHDSVPKERRSGIGKRASTSREFAGVGAFRKHRDGACMHYSTCAEVHGDKDQSDNRTNLASRLFGFCANFVADEAKQLRQKNSSRE